MDARSAIQLGEVINMTDEKKEEKKETKVSKAVEKIVDDVSKLSVLELAELVEVLQDKLGVSAMPMAAAPVAVAGGDDDAKGDGADVAAGGGTVMLTAVDNKIAAIKAIREINQNITLGDAKKMTEELPAEILKDAKPEDAKAAADKLKAAGATVELK